MTGKVITETDTIREILLCCRTIAVVGLSPKPNRDSHRVGRYLLQQGYTVIPIRPAQKEILGCKAYRSIEDLPGPVDIVAVFRRSEQIPDLVEATLGLGPRVFWMQLGIEHRPSAERLTAAGIDVVMNRCIKQDHEAILGFRLGSHAAEKSL
jgi:predicted CoA-binding protein